MVGDASSSSILEAPILLLVSFHKAFRAELDEICSFAWASLLDVSSKRRDLVLDLYHRFQFLKLAYRYHYAAEDEVIFQALDAQIANVACTYSLEHRGVDELFDYAFQTLSVLLENDGNSSKQFQEFMYCADTIQASICQHMLKEEEQVFPLLLQKFSFKEQASLVWQFFCSVPIILLEDLLPWMMSFLSSDKQADVLQCIKEVVPKEKLLQEMLASWLCKNKQRSPGAKSLYFKKFHKENLYGSNPNIGNCSLGELDCSQDTAKHHPVDSLRLWHGAIRKDLMEVLEDLYEMRTSKGFSQLPSICSRLKFLLDVLIFYSDVLENVFFPLLSEFGDCCLPFSCNQFPNGSCIEGLLCTLQKINFQTGTSLCKIVENLCQQLEALTEGINEHFAFQEFEVFPVIHKHLKHDVQQRLLFLSLHIMPLRLLKCVVTWLSARLNEAESKAVLCGINLAGSELDMSFASLLHKWVSLGFSGKTSHDLFKRELQKMFGNISYYLAKNIEEKPRFVDLNLHPCQRFLLGPVKVNFSGKAKRDAKKGAFHSSSKNIKEKDRLLYSTETNLQIFSPDFFKKLSPFSQYLADKDDAGSSLRTEFEPIDYIFLFHKALTNDLNYLVVESTKMVDNVALLEDFRQRFHLVRFLYQIHSDNEDKIAFPALETKGQLQNISLSYTIDHKLETEYFNEISVILDKIFELHRSPSMEISVIEEVQRMLKYRRLCMKLHGKCKTICVTLGKHFQREEIELWPSFREHFSDEEQNKIIGSILGNTRAEILQQMIPWLMASLSSGEQQAMMSLLRKATKYTMFDEWLAEWWEGMSTRDIPSVVEESTVIPWTVDPLEIVATYLSKETCDIEESELHDKGLTMQTEESVGADLKICGNGDGVDKQETFNGNLDSKQCLGLTEFKTEGYVETTPKVNTVTDHANKTGKLLSTRCLEEHILTMSQDDLEAAIRRVYRDKNLDPQKKSYITQTLRTSHWTVNHQKPLQEVTVSNNDGEIPGQRPSYRDTVSYGCKHYKRNCKVFAVCCEKLYTCRYCHDEIADHTMDRKSTTKMMCMKCLKVQPIGPTCSTISCNGLSMGKYFCRICRLYDEDRDIYHCPYCNLCRVGKGLGIDYFHCMNCNACMSKSLAVHICREKCFESNCPICHEDIFSSSSPVKALPCGHMMHSTCFQEYTCMHYTCPICSKSLGDMQVYFRMLDALLAEEKTPAAYFGQTQVILCNDCEKRGVTAFHWLYHKCPYCGSYNTRLL